MTKPVITYTVTAKDKPPEDLSEKVSKAHADALRAHNVPRKGAGRAVMGDKA